METFLSKISESMNELNVEATIKLMKYLKQPGVFIVALLSNKFGQALHFNSAVLKNLINHLKIRRQNEIKVGRAI